MIRDWQYAPDWRENPDARRRQVGASEVAAVLGVSKYRSAFALWQQKIGEVPPVEETDAMRIGNALESVVLDLAEREIGATITRNIRPLYAPGLPRLVATLDGYAEALGAPVEAKAWGAHNASCAQSLADGAVEPGTAAEDLWWQLQAQMMASRTETSFAAMLVDKRLIVARVEADASAVDMICGGVAAFWDLVESRTPPAPQPSDLDAVRKRTRYGDGVIALPALRGDIERRAELKAQIKAADDEIAAIDLRIYAALGERSARRIVAAPGVAISRIRTTSKRTDFKRMLADNPGIDAAYQVDVTTDYLRG